MRTAQPSKEGHSVKANPAKCRVLGRGGGGGGGEWQNAGSATRAQEASTLLLDKDRHMRGTLRDSDGRGTKRGRTNGPMRNSFLLYK